MSKFKIVGMMALIVFATGIVLMGDAVAAEKGKVAERDVFYTTTFHILKVPDVEGHTNFLLEAKGIISNEKWGAAIAYQVYTMDLIKGAGTFQGYTHTTFPDGSTISGKFEGKTTGGGAYTTGTVSSEGTWAYTKGTGKFQGIQGKGTFKSYVLGQSQYYSDNEGEYTLP
jgi:hypothetical protein